MDGFGLKTGKFGQGLWQTRVTVRTVIIGFAILMVGLAQPLNVTSVLATTLLVAGLLVALEVLQRPVVVAPVKKRATAKK